MLIMQLNMELLVNEILIGNFDLWKQENEREEKIKSKKEQEEMVYFIIANI
jgi:hypothetical protein